MLNYKRMNPHSLEQQNEKLSLEIVHVNNPVAFRVLDI